MALDGGLRRREATAAIALPIHAQRTGLADGVGIVGPEVAPDGREAMGARKPGKLLFADVEELVGRDGKRRRYVREAPLPSDATDLCEAQRIAGAAPSLPIERRRCHGPLPCLSIISCDDDLKLGDIGRPSPKRLQATVMLLKRLDVGVRPADGGLESLGAKEPYGL